MQESNAQPEEVVARQRAVLVGLAAAAVLVLLALLWWLSADPATETANAPAAAEVSPATAEPAAAAATDPAFDYRTLPAPVPTVGIPGDASANRDQGGERVIINGALLGELEAEAEAKQAEAGEVELQKPL
ncbi:MAG: hypothetical protein RLZZ169_1548 [Pseudomonadota bacterium]|jgi:hypothetical protein